MRILLTGAAGFLGAALARRLAARPDVDLCALTHGDLDLLDSPAVAAALAARRPDVVVHAAGRTVGDHDTLTAANVVATRNLAEAIGAERPQAGLILLGSAAQYGVSENRLPWRETDVGAPFGPYGETKQAGEAAGFAVARRLGFRIAALRLFNVVAPEPRGVQVFGAFLQGVAQAAAVRPPPWRVFMQPLGAVRDFVDIEDAMTAVERVFDRDAWGEAINVCTGVGRTARDLLYDVVAQTSDIVGIDVRIAASPASLPWSVGDPGLCEARLGFRPSHDLSGLTARAVAWLRATAMDAPHA